LFYFQIIEHITGASTVHRNPFAFANQSEEVGRSQRHIFRTVFSCWIQLCFQHLAL